MKWGHVTGTKKERQPAQPWWAEDEEEAIRKVEQAWAAREAQQTKDAE